MLTQKQITAIHDILQVQYLEDLEAPEVSLVQKIEALTLMAKLVEDTDLALLTTDEKRLDEEAR